MAAMINKSVVKTISRACATHETASLSWSQFKKGQALRREGNKVEVLEGKFRRLKLFFEKLLSKIKNLHSEKKYSVRLHRGLV